MTPTRPISLPALPEIKQHAPMYPDESREDQYAAGRYVSGWNDCHEAFTRTLVDRAAAIPPDAESASEIPEHWPAAWRDVLLERHRQTTKEGWTARHDDEHSTGSMALAAACYACNAASWAQRAASIPAADYTKFAAPGFRWPWAMKWWKPKSQRHDLVRAAALVLAEIERFDRKEAKQ